MNKLMVEHMVVTIVIAIANILKSGLPHGSTNRKANLTARSFAIVNSYNTATK